MRTTLSLSLAAAVLMIVLLLFAATTQGPMGDQVPAAQRNAS